MKKIAHFVTIILIVAICTSTSVSATTDTLVSAAPVSPKASDYLMRYDAYIINNGGGNIAVWFDATATDTIDEIGALTVIIREYTGSYWHTIGVYSNLLAYNTYVYMGNVSFTGVPGRYYYASVTIWAGKDGGGDSRVITTSTIKA